MWSRKRLDIGYRDLFSGMIGCASWKSADGYRSLVERDWASEPKSLAILSVRSGWDLLLKAWKLPPGSEVAISALTIPDMVRIIEHHGLTPVPVDIDLRTMAPTVAQLEQVVTENTRAVLIAHLFGSRADLDGLIDFAHSRNLKFVEDCAQAYNGPDFRGHPRADVSMFSFGTIKSATALGTGVLRVNDENALSRMRETQAAYPYQKRRKLFSRVLKYSALKTVSMRPWYRMLIGACGLIGKDFDRVINGAVRGFAGTDVARFQQQPSASLLRLLHRRLRKFSPHTLERQSRSGARLRERLQGRVPCPAEQVLLHNYWVFPVVSADPPKTMTRLRDAGFDATQGQSMCVVDPPANRPEWEPQTARRLLDHMVFVPMYAALSESAVDRMADALLEADESEWDWEGLRPETDCEPTPTLVSTETASA